VDDHSAAPGDHGGQQLAVQADGRQQAGRQVGQPVLVGHLQYSAGPASLAGGVVDEDVDAAQDA
jgi:hypothetical protein